MVEVTVDNAVAEFNFFDGFIMHDLRFGVDVRRDNGVNAADAVWGLTVFNFKNDRGSGYSLRATRTDRNALLCVGVACIS